MTKHEQKIFDQLFVAIVGATAADETVMPSYGAGRKFGYLAADMALGAIIGRRKCLVESEHLGYDTPNHGTFLAEPKTVECLPATPKPMPPKVV